MYRTPAFVLSRTERREADLLLSLFTERYGLISASAIGVRKPGAKLRGHLEDLSKTEIHFVSGKSGYRLIGAILTDPFREIVLSPERRFAAASATAMIGSSSFAGSPDPELWGALNDFFLALNSKDQLDASQCERILFWFAARLFYVLGYQASENGLHPPAVQELFRLYEKTPVLAAVGFPFEPDLHEAVRRGLARAFEEHLGTNIPFFSAA